MRLLSRLCVFALLVFFIGGCNEVTTPLTLSVSIFAPQPGVFEEPWLEGVKVCETGTTNCTMTDANGQATLLPPIDQEISYTLEKKTYASNLYADVISTRGLQVRTGLGTDRSLADIYERLGVQYPMVGMGTVALFVLPWPGLAGATFDLVGATSTPFYVDEEGNWSTDLTATTSAGWGGFLEVAPGEFQIDLGGTAQGCVPDWGWPGDVENSIRFPSERGISPLSK